MLFRSPFPEFGRGSWVHGSSCLDWVVDSGYAEEWALLGDWGRLEWEWTSFGPRKVPWVDGKGVCELTGVAMVCVACSSCCMVMGLVWVDGLGQLGKGEVCMHSNGVRVRSKFLFSPYKATSPQLNLVGTSEAL